MTIIYDTLQDYFRGNTYEEGVVYDSISVSPYWCMAIIRQAYPATFSRERGTSFSNDINKSIETKEMLLLTDECLELKISNSKSTHLTSLFAGLLETKDNLLVNINPGDYVFAWIVNNKNDFSDLLDSIKNKKPCNSFYSGLKFLGKVNSIRKMLTQQPDGKRIARYTLNANGFEEFDSTIHYEPTLSREFPGLSSFYTGLNLSLENMVTDVYNGAHGVFSSQSAIVQILETLFGKGIAKNLGTGNDDPKLRSTRGKDYTGYASIMPSEVGSLLGIQGSVYNDKGVVNYADILQTSIGIQTYASTAPGKINNEIYTPWLYPIISKKNDAFFQETLHPIPGSLDPSNLSMALTSNSVWSILDSILNKAVNESYTCLKSGSDGKIRPTLVIRQIPFTTEASKAAFDEAGIKYTGFLDLPRWKIHPLMVKMVDIGKSNSVRFNYVMLFGKTSATQSEPSDSSQIVNNGPKFDELDIVRHGFRPWNATATTWLADLRTTKFQQYINIISDFMIGQHMTFSGIINTVGIQAPICAGDNIEWDGGVFHVEGVVHSCRIDNDGRKTFETSMAITNGVRSDPQGIYTDSVYDNGTMNTKTTSYDDSQLYLGIKKTDNATYNPGQTKDSEFSKNNTDGEK